MGLCKHRDIAGKPEEGVHAIRFMGMAAFDIVGSLILATVIALATGWNLAVCVFVVFVLGVIVHRLFCVNTAVNKFIFGEV